MFSSEVSFLDAVILLFTFTQIKYLYTLLQNYDSWISQIPDIPNLSKQHTEMYVNEILSESREKYTKTNNKNNNKLAVNKEKKNGDILPISNPYSVNVFYESHGALFTIKQDRERLKYRL